MQGTSPFDDTTVELQHLLQQFYREPGGSAQLAEFSKVSSLPSPDDVLLDHHGHMTSAMETHYREPVDVEVHRTRRNDDWYSREITLHTRHTGKAVLYAITLLQIDALEPAVWDAIASEQIPLGRVLMNHDIVRDVRRCELWRLRAGPNLATLLPVSVGATLSGRTALIRCNGRPAIGLLEILAPV
ncbi:MAG: hypothetical protein KDI16_15205 [Halioglobus sp.]|nr:hypothetical protein [Halioglobus sp.]